MKVVISKLGLALSVHKNQIKYENVEVSVLLVEAGAFF